MLISHEVPICLLEESKQFNDYDYCLLHLTYKFPTYKQFYIDSVKEGRKVILDNSLYELGDALTNKQLAEGVMELNPTEYIVPDCLNDKDVTMKRFDEFIKEYPDLKGIKIGVVQGKTISELIECYKYMSKHADKIAIPFGSVALEEIGAGDNPFEKRAVGRIAFINYLVEHKIWNYDKPHHLLGCNVPFEFTRYKDIKNIESIDTSNPIIRGILNREFDAFSSRKPKMKVNDLIDATLSTIQRKLIIQNVKEFREMIIHN